MSDGNFYCIYSGTEQPEQERALEHIVPYSIGGPGELATRDVCKKANSDAGALADSPLVNHPFITMHRWRLQLKGQSGKVPGISFPGTMEVDGVITEVEYIINPDGSGELRTTPQVKSDWNAGEFHVNCDPADLPTILDNIARKGLKKGFDVSPETIKVKSSKHMKIETPTISTDITIGRFDLVPGFTKMALGTGHLLFGEQWSRSGDAELLRRVITEPDPAVRNLVRVHGQVWPNLVGGSDPMREMFYIDDDKHVLVVLNQKPAAFYALLFGQYGGYIQLSEFPVSGGSVGSGRGIVFVVCCKTRKVASFDLEDFVTRQAIEKGQI
jgi:HNH endonuclease